MLSTKLKEAAGNSADATLYVNDVFSTYLYAGNGSTQTITNGIDLAGKGGLVWVKGRSGTYAAYNHSLHDTQRGLVYRLSTNNTNAQSNEPADINSFNSNGFTLGGGALTNDPSTTYASWTFRKAAKFFDVQTVTHTNGTANNIDLSVLGTVGMVIAKITTTTGDWTVWHRSLTAGNNFQLNTTNPQSTTNAWLSVSGTTATLAAAAPTGTYVIYAYAHDTAADGIIQCGLITTDAGGIGSTTLGWEPQFIITKSVSANSSSSFVTSSMQGMSLTSSNWFYADAASAEQVTSPESFWTPNATGFSISGHPVSSSIVYMAIRMPNKPPTSGTQVFGLNARTGTGANATVTGGQTNDAVLIKNRGSAVADLFSSRLTGTGYLVTSSTAAEVAAGTTILQANPWDVMDGVKVGTTSTITNASANTFINYMFKRAPGFFDVVCYTGAPTAYSGRSISHNLGVMPELAIFKARSAASTTWSVGGFNNCDGTGLILNTTAAFNASGPLFGGSALNTATNMYIAKNTGAAFDVDASGVTYVAYLFATLAGISKVGSYTGNGTGQAIACGFSAGARFVLIKRTDSTGDWYTFDSARGLTSGSSPYLLLNSTAAEVTGNNGVYASTGGFTLGATAITTTNIVGASYIYLSVA